MYTAYVDDSTFLLRDLRSVKYLIDTFTNFSKYSGLKPNLSKCEISGIGSLKGVIKAACGLKSVNLTSDTLRILGVHFYCNQKLQNEKNFVNIVKKIRQIIGPWKTRSLSLEGKILIFKTLAISKIVYISLITVVPRAIVEELQTIQKQFL